MRKLDGEERKRTESSLGLAPLVRVLRAFDSANDLQAGPMLEVSRDLADIFPSSTKVDFTTPRSR